MRGIFYKKLIFALFFLPLLAFAQAALVNINTAGLEELDTLPGVGPAIAQRIIDGRPYAAVEEISRVQGIGEPGSSTYDNIIGFITVGSEASGLSSASNRTTNQKSSSAHYSAASTSQPPENESKKMALSAGRDRVGSVGSPMEFKAETNFKHSRRDIFSWNFGDGTVGGGPVTTHMYEYPGEYVVVLTASISDEEVIARANVKIVDPKLSIVAVTPEKIDIANGSSYEINLFGRSLVSGDRVFSFPKDTIIRSGQITSFSSRATGLRPLNKLEVMLITQGEEPQAHQIFAKASEQKALEIAKIEGEILTLQNELAHRVQNIAANNVAAAPAEEVGELAEEEDLSTSLTASAVESSFWQKFKQFFLRNSR